MINVPYYGILINKNLQEERIKKLWRRDLTTQQYRRSFQTN